MSEKGKPKMPSIFTMAKTFTADLAKYVKEGAPNVSPESYKKRLETCAACPDLIKDKMRCGQCGCLVEHKAKWKTTDCPNVPSKWPVELMITDREHQKKPDPEASDEA
tara:strand:- start:806 stop:1129 length:324 start_codon:yes stop_codon:yes gene_type:complete